MFLCGRHSGPVPTLSSRWSSAPSPLPPPGKPTLSQAFLEEIQSNKETKDFTSSFLFPTSLFLTPGTTATPSDLGGGPGHSGDDLGLLREPGRVHG